MHIVGSRIHATAVAWGAHCVLLRGPSGSGKSDLALRLVSADGTGAQAPSWRLVGDDQVELAREGAAVTVVAPEALRGKLEVRGFGIVDVPFANSALAALVVDLMPREAVDRLPDADIRIDVLGVPLPRLLLHAFDTSAPIKLRLALKRAVGDG